MPRAGGSGQGGAANGDFLALAAAWRTHGRAGRLARGNIPMHPYAWRPSGGRSTHAMT